MPEPNSMTSPADVALTGARGFLGLHVRAALAEAGMEVAEVELRADQHVASAHARRGADHVIHLAGVNRGAPSEVAEGNLEAARALAAWLRRNPHPPGTVTYANSVHAGRDDAYGQSKAAAATLLAETAEEVGAVFRDVRLSNLFGEFGRPDYNSVVATFVDRVVRGERPPVASDARLCLVHASHAADALVAPDATAADLEVHAGRLTVRELAARLTGLHRVYAEGQIPDLWDRVDRDLFNTLRAALYPARLHIPITAHVDHRGSFFEIVRAHGGTGQTSFSTTRPGVTRGHHFHRRKVERFTVLAGEAEIRLRRFDSDRTHRVRVSGVRPVSVDMPTLVAHSIENVGSTELLTAFWTDDLFHPAAPDTIPAEA